MDALRIEIGCTVSSNSNSNVNSASVKKRRNNNAAATPHPQQGQQQYQLSSSTSSSPLKRQRSHEGGMMTMTGIIPPVSMSAPIVPTTIGSSSSVSNSKNESFPLPPSLSRGPPPRSTTTIPSHFFSMQQTSDVDTHGSLDQEQDTSQSKKRFVLLIWGH
mmetsp:Transcript_14833/g.17196  ORF Transcript_14833/g.17196 Transcript_14833/m.17196 type:complete len:160 (-) Transcript_14833:6-485(-)